MGQEHSNHRELHLKTHEDRKQHVGRELLVVTEVISRRLSREDEVLPGEIERVQVKVS